MTPMAGSPAPFPVLPVTTEVAHCARTTAPRRGIQYSRRQLSHCLQRTPGTGGAMSQSNPNPNPVRHQLFSSIRTMTLEPLVLITGLPCLFYISQAGLKEGWATPSNSHSRQWKTGWLQSQVFLLFQACFPQGPLESHVDLFKRYYMQICVCVFDGVKPVSPTA